MWVRYSDCVLVGSQLYYRSTRVLHLASVGSMGEEFCVLSKRGSVPSRCTLGSAVLHKFFLRDGSISSGLDREPQMAFFLVASIATEHKNKRTIFAYTVVMRCLQVRYLVYYQFTTRSKAP